MGDREAIWVIGPDWNSQLGAHLASAHFALVQGAMRWVMRADSDPLTNAGSPSMRDRWMVDRSTARNRIGNGRRESGERIGLQQQLGIVTVGQTVVFLGEAGG